ncbi:MAG: DUF4442 domain-containing protein [Planctomycetota bacterium]|nr:MAG: DUF4442 domain-containing protein [Planctomycetota bacterium]
MARSGFRGPRRLRPWQMRWMLNLYPPFLVQRIRVESCSSDFLAARVRIRSSLFTRNLNGTIFGGTLYAACDPIYPILYWQALARRGREVQAWLMAAEIRFLKPASGLVRLEFRLNPADLDAAEAELDRRGKSVRAHPVRIVDRAGRICAEASTVSYLRDLAAGDRGGSAF